MTDKITNLEANKIVTVELNEADFNKNGYIITFPEVVEVELDKDEEDYAYFAGYDYCYISDDDYKEIWKLLTNNYTRQVHAEGFARYSFGPGAPETGWIVGTLTDEYDCNLGAYSIGTSVENSIAWAGYPDYDHYPTRLPYGVVFENGLEMKFHGDAPFKSNAEQLIKWLKQTNKTTKIELMPLVMEFMHDAIESSDWIAWCGIYRRKDSELIRVLDDGIELLGELSSQVDSSIDFITKEDNLATLMEWIQDGGEYPFLTI